MPLPASTHAPLDPDPCVYRPMDAVGDVHSVTRLISLAFASPDKAAEWLDCRTSACSADRVGRPRPASFACRWDSTSEKRAIPMEGAAGVAVAPESRGRGLALNLMRELVREIAHEGVPLTALYASTQSLYRQVTNRRGTASRPPSQSIPSRPTAVDRGSIHASCGR